MNAKVVAASPRSYPAKEVDNLLSLVLTTRLQRKVKTILISSFEFIFTVAAIFLAVNENEMINDEAKLRLFIFLCVSGLYTLHLALFLSAHALFYLPKNTKTSEEVEEAFTATNKCPLDGLLECPLPAKFKGSIWFLPYIMWVLFITIFVAGAILFYGIELETSTLATTGAGALLLYEVTSDFAEYWVFSRNQVGTKPIFPDSNATAYDAMEVLTFD